MIYTYKQPNQLLLKREEIKNIFLTIRQPPLNDFVGASCIAVVKDKPARIDAARDFADPAFIEIKSSETS